MSTQTAAYWPQLKKGALSNARRRQAVSPDDFLNLIYIFNAPDPVDDAYCQDQLSYFDGASLKKLLLPERTLIIALIRDAIDVLTSPIKATTTKERQDVYHWIFNGANDLGAKEWPFSFENACESLGLEVSYFRRKLRELLRRKKIRLPRC